MKRTRAQKRFDASKRLSKAVDRGIVATSETEKAQAKKWVLAWQLVAKL
jgi:hypothetical protein